MMPKVSVVIPMYRAERFIGEALESLCSQTMGDWEAIVVDDGSPDHSREVADSYARVDRRIRVLEHPERTNRGVAASRALGVAESRGQFIALLDADDAFEPEKLALQLESAAEHPDCVMYHTGGITVDADGVQVPEPTLTTTGNTFAQTAREYHFRDDPDYLVRNAILNSSTLIRAQVARRELIPLNQLFQYEDWLLWTRVSHHGPFFVQPDRLLRYRMHDGSATSKVMRSRLVEIFSHVEYLLSLLAMEEKDPRINEVLQTRLVDAVAMYRQSIDAGEKVLEGIDLDLKTLNQPAKPKRRRWYRRLFGLKK